MTSNRDRRTKPSVAQQVFGKMYVPHIAEMVLQKHGASYACYANNRNTWRASIPYSPKIESEIILETKMFIVFLDHHVQKLAENPAFVMAVVKNIVDYLSAYTMKNPAFPNRTRRQAKDALMKTLWDDFKHIQAMLARQASQRAARQERNIRYIRKSENSAAKDAYEKIKATRRRLALGHDPKQK